MELLALTVRGVTLFTLEAIEGNKREELLQKINRLRDKNNDILCIDVLLDFISNEAPSAFLRECYGKLRELVTWGYIFFAILKGTGEAPDDDLTDFIAQLEVELKTDNFTAVSYTHLDVYKRQGP